MMDDGLSRIFNKKEPWVNLGTKVIGRKIFAYDLVTSTNDLALFLAKNGEPEGTVVFAKGQTQGRGRLGKTWVSPYGQGLYCSVILRPRVPVSQAPRITLTAALAVVTALEEVPVENISLKWPNDVLIGERKVCGILTEMSLREEAIDHIVVGIGVNVNASRQELLPEATSLIESTGREFDIADLSHIIIRKLDLWYGVFLQHKFLNILQKVKERSGLILGGRVRVAWKDREIEGYAVDFDEDGALIVRRDNGILEKIAAGHLTKL